MKLNIVIRFEVEMLNYKIVYIIDRFSGKSKMY